MSIWNRLTGSSTRSRSERSPVLNKLRLESLESREVMSSATFVGGWEASAYQYTVESPSQAAVSSVPTEQLSINFTKIEYKNIGMSGSGQGTTPAASDFYLLDLDGVKGESRVIYNRFELEDAKISSWQSGANSGAGVVGSDYSGSGFDRGHMTYGPLLEIDGINGETKASNHQDQIEISSFSWGVSQHGAHSDVMDDGRIITAENSDGPTAASHGYIRIKKLNSGG